ncbi:AMP-dependent synthetase/ligase [Sandaracinus amylolyticus]|uniref:Long-chain-fatty-acid--CoA ligase n=1 Tax=Sandaracinus amylolyticus TaxID=927083 RepID=A0A0F6YLU9_9BACT|nr:long-chain fatty acid--CoA ligase [Sandaracinus amylolyticus]AKF10320.1 Long-chain-fatty-acid--CoA ligase [Sandaracinus amylolyticus]
METTTEPSTATRSRKATEGFKPRFDSLVAIYEHATTSFAERPLFGTKKNGEWKWLTYREFAQQTDEVRAALAELGVGVGDRVAMIANNRAEWAIAAYATYGRKGAFVPMYESQMPKEWEYILKDCGAKVVICASEKIRDAILGLRGNTPDLQHVVVVDGSAKDGSIGWSDLRAKGRGKKVPNEKPQPDDLAGLIYTSGTTGNPKGVRLSHANLASNVSAMHEVFPMSPEDRSLSFLPWAHSFGQTVELHGLFSMGASMGIAESVDKIIDNLGEVKPTLLFSVPRIFNRIYDRLHKQMAEATPLRRRIFESAVANAAHRKKLAEQRRTSGFADFKQRIFDRVVFQKVRDRFGGRLRYAFSGGAAISKEVAEFIDNLGITVYEGYGLTETSPIATANWPGARKIGSVGKAIPGVRIAIDLGATGDPRNGEVVVFGHNVMQGYYNLPEENEKVFTEDGGFRTGDMGYLDDDGFLYITGRIKEQYKLENGKYVAPAPLEDKLKLSPYVANTFVYGDNKPYNVALVVPEMKEIEEWAQAQQIHKRGSELLEDEKVVALLRGEIDKYSGEFKQFEKIKKIKLIAEDFTQENGMLTPKLSLKRRVVMQRWGAEIEKLYT